jgi:phosphoglycolate phosphatase
VRARSALLFDLDGTLVDSSTDIVDAVNDVLQQFGWGQLTVEQLAPHVGWGMLHVFERAFTMLDPARPPEDESRLREHFLPAYEARLQRHTRPFPEVLSVLASLRGRWPLGVVTNKPQELSDRLLEGLGMSSYFGTVVGYRRGLARKPDPAPVLEALDALSAVAEGSWMIGDTLADLEAGHAAGLKVAILTHGPVSQPPALLEAADRVCAGFGELARELSLNPRDALAPRP